MDKKGFIRTMEAVISVILLFSFIFFMSYYNAPETSEAPFIIRNTHNFIFEEIVYNSTFRDCIIQKAHDGSCRQYDLTGADACMKYVDDFVKANSPEGYEYECEACRSAVSCLEGSLPIDRNVYANSIFLASDNPKIMRIYFWER